MSTNSSVSSPPGHWLIGFKGMRSRDSMLKAIARTLEFPPHFGMNLDALYDCLTDLPLRDGGAYSIVLDELARSPAGDAVHAVFTDAVVFWRERGVSLKLTRE